MKAQGLQQLFIDELKDMYDAELQIIDALPNLIRLASSEELKEALSNHLDETEEQVERIEKIFNMLGLPPKQNRCEGMEGILNECDEITENKTKSPTLDAAIICAAQKVEHYEIASYGTLHSFAESLDMDKEIRNLLQETLDEEKAADKKLTKLAEGSFLTNGINADAAENQFAMARKRNY